MIECIWRRIFKIFYLDSKMNTKMDDDDEILRFFSFFVIELYLIFILNRRKNMGKFY